MLFRSDIMIRRVAGIRKLIRLGLKVEKLIYIAIQSSILLIILMLMDYVNGKDGCLLLGVVRNYLEYHMLNLD